MAELVLLAVTRMVSGVCIGGAAPGGGPWLRPVKPFGCVQLGDIRFANGALMRPFDIVSLNLLKPQPDPPHVEDVLCDFVHPRPEWRGRLEEPERLAFLESCMDPRPAEIWCRVPAQRVDGRSLTLFEPEALTAAFAYDSYSEKFECRIAWPGYDRPQGVPVTDLKWRALGREWAGGRGGRTPRSGGQGGAGPVPGRGPQNQQYDLPSLRRRLGVERLFLAVGLSRNYQGQFWPIVVGVHTLPDYPATVDERRL